MGMERIENKYEKPIELLKKSDLPVSNNRPISCQPTRKIPIQINNKTPLRGGGAGDRVDREKLDKLEKLKVETKEKDDKRSLDYNPYSTPNINNRVPKYNPLTNNNNNNNSNHNNIKSNEKVYEAHKKILPITRSNTGKVNLMQNNNISIPTYICRTDENERVVDRVVDRNEGSKIERIQNYYSDSKDKDSTDNNTNSNNTNNTNKLYNKLANNRYTPDKYTPERLNKINSQNISSNQNINSNHSNYGSNIDNKANIKPNTSISSITKSPSYKNMSGSINNNIIQQNIKNIYNPVPSSQGSSNIKSNITHTVSDERRLKQINQSPLNNNNNNNMNNVRIPENSNYGINPRIKSNNVNTNKFINISADETQTKNDYSSNNIISKENNNNNINNINNIPRPNSIHNKLQNNYSAINIPRNNLSTNERSNTPKGNILDDEKKILTRPIRIRLLEQAGNRHTGSITNNNNNKNINLNNLNNFSNNNINTNIDKVPSYSKIQQNKNSYLENQFSSNNNNNSGYLKQNSSNDNLKSIH